MHDESAAIHGEASDGDGVVLAPPPASPSAALASLHPAVADWFRFRYGLPTTAQCHAWPLIAKGEHFLLSAPTGSGKTWAAFLPILSELLGENATPLSPGVRCVYLSPLRALCNDMERNLAGCLESLSAVKPIRAVRRTGETSAAQRSRLWHDPPHLLLTTPESLALLLAHRQAGALLGEVRWVVVDEVHAFVPSKRGCDVAVTLERLAALSRSEPQRIGLSATCSPLAEAGRWLAGSHRRITLAAVEEDRPLDLHLAYLPLEECEANGFIQPLLRRLVPQLHRAETTLIFTNTRSIAERLVWCLRREMPDWANQIAVHHSAIAGSRRRTVEGDLKAGRLRVVVTSTSLELGIDIGSVEQVVLIHPPGGAARLLQRLGRSGHAPGRPRRGICFVSHPADLLEAVVTAEAGRHRHLESLRVPTAPLDVLCQQLIGMAAARPWTAAEAWHLVRDAYPYRELSLEAFATCLDYLSGFSPASQNTPRIRWEDGRFRLFNRRTLRMYRTNVGVLSDEEVRTVRTDEGQEIGALNEEFADGLQPGDRFLLAGRCFEVARQAGGEITVQAAGGLPRFTRWKGGLWRTPQSLAESAWHFRCQFRDDPQITVNPLSIIENEAQSALRDFLEAQETVSEIPDDSAILVEASRAEDDDAFLYAFHLPLGQPGCEAVGRVAAYRLHCRMRVAGLLGFTLTVQRSEPLSEAELVSALDPAGFREDLERAMLGTTALAEQFRKTACNGLMLLRKPLGRRRTVGGRHWAGRRLFHWLRFVDPHFPLLRQAIHDTFLGVCDVAAAEGCLRRLRDRPLRVRYLERPSPFAEAWEAQRLMFGPLGDGLTELQATTSGRNGVRIEDGLLLTAQRAAVHLPSHSAVIADVHLGYDTARQASGEAVPSLGWTGLRRRLETLLSRFPLRRLVVAGDLVENGRQDKPVRELLGWLAERGIELWLVPGNHDRGLGLLDGLRLAPDGMRLGRWLVRHTYDSSLMHPQIIGHHHPTVRLRDWPRPVPCFLVRSGLIVLPASSDDAAGMRMSTPRSFHGFVCHAIVEDEVRTVSEKEPHSEPEPMRLTSSSPGRPKEITEPYWLFGK
ncbi:MAG: DEAD/DEAH box helicase [Gemmatales bacterium]|nr:DEAD/DEAH box helicase [Gemmatales bacterium]MDW8386303.1 DEAD/DEAH box helicase [Gemmatales bacterium]